MEQKVYTIVPENMDGTLMGDFKDSDVVRADYCYLHWELEDKIGYDIFNMLKSELKPNQINDRWLSDEFEEGIYPCICVGIPCVFFRWRTGFDRKRYKGLVVMLTDTEGLEQARKCYEDKVSSL
jgi:hypothetical protein